MLKLFYTPKSHFSRKVRILVDALNAELKLTGLELINLELIDVGNVADNTIESFGENPLMKVPTLIDESADENITVFDSDHIAQYIVRKFDPNDTFNVLASDPKILNARAVMNGVMSAEVELILAQRTGIDTTQYQRFAKIKNSIIQGMDWLENHCLENKGGIFSAQATYLEFHLIAMWDHLKLYNVIDLKYPSLQNKVEQLSAMEFIKESKP